MANKQLVSAHSAMPGSMKYTTLVEDLCRHFRNTSPSLIKSQMEELVTEFNARMAMGNHNEVLRYKVTEDAIRKYWRMVEDDINGTKKLYRDKNEILLVSSILYL